MLSPILAPSRPRHRYLHIFQLRIPFIFKTDLCNAPKLLTRAPNRINAKQFPAICYKCINRKIHLHRSCPFGIRHSIFFRHSSFVIPPPTPHFLI